MADQKNNNRADEVKMDVAVVLGRTRERIENMLSWTEGSLIELHKRSGSLVDVEVNGTHFAKGEVVSVGENFGVRITERGSRKGTEETD